MERNGPGSEGGPGRWAARRGGTARRGAGRWLPALVAMGLALSACGLHVSKHGVSVNAFGHRFSASSGQMPVGFPSSVPVPDNSRVLIGGGSDNRSDVGFAVTGSLTQGTTAYQDKFQSAGYTLSNIQSGSTPATGPPSGSPTTTLTLTGSVFTATDAQWTVQVESGTTSSSKTGVLKAGEFAINITVVPAESTPPPTT
jgi:hypothetical protein